MEANYYGFSLPWAPHIMWPALWTELKWKKPVCTKSIDVPVVCACVWLVIRVFALWWTIVSEMATASSSGARKRSTTRQNSAEDQALSQIHTEVCRLQSLMPTRISQAWPSVTTFWGCMAVNVQVYAGVGTGPADLTADGPTIWRMNFYVHTVIVSTSIDLKGTLILKFILRKIRHHILRVKCTKIDFHRGFALDPAGEATVLSVCRVSPLCFQAVCCILGLLLAVFLNLLLCFKMCYISN